MNDEKISQAGNHVFEKLLTDPEMIKRMAAAIKSLDERPAKKPKKKTDELTQKLF